MVKARRIRQSDRELMAASLLTHTFQSKVLELRAEYADLAGLVYRDIYDEVTRKRMASLPKGWLPTSTMIQVRMGGETANLYFGEGFYSSYSYRKVLNLVNRSLDQPEAVYLYMLYEHIGTTVAVYDVGHPLQVEFEGLEQKTYHLVEQIEQAQVRAKSVLGKYTTFDKLREEWPEIIPFIPVREERIVNLPALPVAELNKLFDLPVDQKAA